MLKRKITLVNPNPGILRYHIYGYVSWNMEMKLYGGMVDGTL